MFKGILRVEKGLFCLLINPYCDVINPFNYNFPINFFIVLLFCFFPDSQLREETCSGVSVEDWRSEAGRPSYSGPRQAERSRSHGEFFLSFSLSLSLFPSFLRSHFISSLILSLPLKVSRMKNAGVDPGGFRSLTWRRVL